MPKRSSDNYIRLQKKITNPDLIKNIKEIAKDRLTTDQETCYNLICEGVVRELDKKKKIQEITKQSR